MKILLVGDACSRSPTIIKFHNLHGADSKRVVGEIISYMGGTSFLPFLGFVRCASFDLSLAFPFVFYVMVLAIDFDWKNPLNYFSCIDFDLLNFTILNITTFSNCLSLLDLFNFYNLPFNCCTMLDFECHQLLSSFALKSFQIFSILFASLLLDAQCWIVRAIDYFQISPCNATFFVFFFHNFSLGLNLSFLNSCDCQGITM